MIEIKFDKTIGPLVFIMSKISGYVKIFKVEEGGNKSMSFHTDDEKLLGKCKAIWTKIEDLKNIELNALSVYVDRCIKTKIKPYGDKVYTNFRGLNVPEVDIPGVLKKALHSFKSLLFNVMWSKYYKILKGYSGIIF